MEELSRITQHPFFALGGFAIGLVSIILAYVFYKKGKNNIKINYSMRSFNFINESASEIPLLEIKYGGEPVSKLTATRIAVWNSGHSVVHRDYISQIDPLRIESVDGNLIYSAKIIAQSKKANIVIADLDTSNKQIAKLSFDYLDENEGFVVFIIHDGVDHEIIKIEGTIKGCHSLNQADWSPSLAKGAEILVFYGSAACLMSLYEYLKKLEVNIYLNVAIISVIALVIMWLIISRLSQLRGIPNIPKPLISVFEDGLEASRVTN